MKDKNWMRFFNSYKCNPPPESGSEKTLMKKREKDRAVLIWDTSKKGIFRGNLRRTFNLNNIKND